MRHDLINLENLRQHIFEVFYAWPGYDCYSRVVKQFPHLDVYVAGGVVRNAMLGLGEQSKDFDLFFSGEQIDAVLQTWAKDGIMLRGPYGNPRWLPDAKSNTYCDLIPITRFTPGLWQCEDIVDVLNQFDFTGNAVAFELRQGHFFDPQNGLRDMDKRVLRCVRFDYPDEPYIPSRTLSRLAILWFRLIHYATVLGLTIEPITKQWLIRSKHHFLQRELFTAEFFEPILEPDLLSSVGIYV